MSDVSALEIVSVALGAATLVAAGLAATWAKPGADFAREEMKRREREDARTDLRFLARMRDIGELVSNSIGVARSTSGSMDAPTRSVSGQEWAELQDLSEAAGRAPAFLSVMNTARAAGAAPGNAASQEQRNAYADTLQPIDTMIRDMLELSAGDPYPTNGAYVLDFLERHGLS